MLTLQIWPKSEEKGSAQGLLAYSFMLENDWGWQKVVSFPDKNPHIEFLNHFTEKDSQFKRYIGVFGVIPWNSPKNSKSPM